MTVWDPVSKQPSFKTAACRVTRLRAGDGPAPAPTNTASAPVPSTGDTQAARRRPAVVLPTSSQVLTETPRYALDPTPGGQLMPHLATYVALADHSEQTLADSLRAVAGGHARQSDVFHTCHTLAGWSDQHREDLAPVVERYGEQMDVDEPERLRADVLTTPARARSVSCATSRTCTCWPPWCTAPGP